MDCDAGPVTQARPGRLGAGPATANSRDCEKVMAEERLRVVRCGGSELNFRRAVFSADSKYGTTTYYGRAVGGAERRESSRVGTRHPRIWAGAGAREKRPPGTRERAGADVLCRNEKSSLSAVAPQAGRVSRPRTVYLRVD